MGQRKPNRKPGFYSKICTTGDNKDWEHQRYVAVSAWDFCSLGVLHCTCNNIWAWNKTVWKHCDVNIQASYSIFRKLFLVLLLSELRVLRRDKNSLSLVVVRLGELWRESVTLDGNLWHLQPDPFVSCLPLPMPRPLPVQQQRWCHNDTCCYVWIMFTSCSTRLPVTLKRKKTQL